MELSHHNKEITNIFAKFVKLRHNWLWMGMCASSDIFESKIDELLGYIEGFKLYIYNIIVLSKDVFTKRIGQIGVIFYRLCRKILKSNTPRCSLG